MVEISSSGELVLENGETVPIKDKEFKILLSSKVFEKLEEKDYKLTYNKKSREMCADTTPPQGVDICQKIF